MDPLTLDWVKKTIAELIKTAPDYWHQALYRATLAAIEEQNQRLNNGAGELDYWAWDGKTRDRA